MPDIRSGESQLTIVYRIEPGDGTRYVMAVTIISPEVAGNIMAGVTTNYVLVSPIQPAGYPYTFLRAVAQDWTYVKTKTGLTEYQARFLAYLLPVLTVMPPPDLVLEVAVEVSERARREMESQ